MNPASDSGLNVYKDGHHVSRRSDYIIYSVEAAFINSVVAQYGPCELLSQQLSMTSKTFG